MIDLTLALLRLSDFKNVSERVDIAKGKHKLPMTLKEGWYKFKRFKR